MRNALLLVTILFFFASCEDRAYYQKSFGFKNNMWSQNVKPKFETFAFVFDSKKL